MRRAGGSTCGYVWAASDEDDCGRPKGHGGPHSVLPLAEDRDGETVVLVPDSVRQLDENDVDDLAALVDDVVINGTTFVFLRDGVPVAALTSPPTGLGSV